MSNHWSEELITAYIDQRLDAQQRQEVEAYLAENAEARQMLRDFQKIRQQFSTAPEYKLDAGFSDRVLTAIDTQPVAQSSSQSQPPVQLASPDSRQNNFWNWKTLSAAAAALAAAILVGIFLLPNPQQPIADNRLESGQESASTDSEESAVDKPAEEVEVEALDSSNSDVADADLILRKKIQEEKGRKSIQEGGVFKRGLTKDNGESVLSDPDGQQQPRRAHQNESGTPGSSSPQEGSARPKTDDSRKRQANVDSLAQQPNTGRSASQPTTAKKSEPSSWLDEVLVVQLNNTPDNLRLLRELQTEMNGDSAGGGEVENGDAENEDESTDTANSVVQSLFGSAETAFVIQVSEQELNDLLIPFDHDMLVINETNRQHLESELARVASLDLMAENQSIDQDADFQSGQSIGGSGGFGGRNGEPSESANRQESLSQGLQSQESGPTIQQIYPVQVARKALSISGTGNDRKQTVPRIAKGLNDSDEPSEEATNKPSNAPTEATAVQRKRYLIVVKMIAPESSAAPEDIR